MTGGAGYVGSALVPKLLDAGYEVIVYDLMLFGEQGLPSHPRLRVITGDIRDRKSTRLNSSHSAKSRMPSSA